jgi:hypothetical protein
MIIAGLRGGEVIESQTHTLGTGCLPLAQDLALESVTLRSPLWQRDRACESFHVQFERQNLYGNTKSRVWVSNHSKKLIPDCTWENDIATQKAEKLLMLNAVTGILY